MIFAKLQKTVLLVLAALGITEIPISAEQKVDFTPDQEAKLKEKLGDDMYAKIVTAFNKEIEAMQENTELLAVKAELDALVQEAAVDEELGAQGRSRDPQANVTATDSLASVKALIQKQQETINKLMQSDASDNAGVIDLAKNREAMKHSATHLFGSSNAWDKFEGRPWNQRMKDMNAKATDFNNDSYIPLLQDDLEHFVRENPNTLDSLFNDFLDLPSEWSRRSGVLDRIATGTIIAAEIVQGRKKGWQPKNKFKITPEEGRVFRKKIDVTFSGFELQEIENTWIRSYNKEGSHPWKYSFVGFLLGELIKQQMLDDRNAQVNGIFAENLNEDEPGRAINSQDGLLFYWWYYRDVVKKYRPFKVSFGAPTKANIVDYVREMIESMPEVERKEQGLEIQMSPQIHAWYRETAGKEYQVHMSTDEGRLEYAKTYPIDYPNFKLQEIRDMNDTLFIGITKSRNVEIMDYKTEEKRKFTITHEKRDTNIFADYRLGIRFMFVGTTLSQNDPSNFERQMLWSNDVPIFSNKVRVPIFDDETGIVKMKYAHMKVDRSFATNIVDIADVPEGMIISIQGDTGLAGAVNIVNNAKLVIGSNFNLKSGGTLTLRKMANNTFVQVKRTTAPDAAATTDVNFATGVVDANLGNVFRFTGATTTAITDILNGVELQEITIFGTATPDVNVTLQSIANKISLTGNATLSGANKFIKLARIDGVWYETQLSV